MKAPAYLAYALAGAVLLQAAIHVTRPEPDTGISCRSIRCAIDIDKTQKHLPGLIVGYNYFLLEKCAEALEDTLVSIVNAGPGSSYLDSLRMGVVDIVAITYSDSLQVDSISFSRPIDSLTVWAVRADRTDGLEQINAWLDALPQTEGYEDDRNCFLNRYSPQKRAGWGRVSRRICPYDEILKRHARTIGWDWRLLAALVYHESKFHIEAVSPRGAQGLMQMMPHTADRYGVTNIFDPEQSVEAGAAFLGRLQRMFSDKAANPDELRKMTLAAYNAGEGRILDCIHHAESIGADASTWDAIVSVIPDMRDSLSVRADSTVRLGTFQGYETIAYVGQVLSLYDNFKAIHPEP